MMQSVTGGVHCSDDGHLVVQPVGDGGGDGVDESDQIRRYCTSWDVIQPITKYVAIKRLMKCIPLKD